jgi:hypothetical protein
VGGNGRAEGLVNRAFCALKVYRKLSTSPPVRFSAGLKNAELADDGLNLLGRETGATHRFARAFGRFSSQHSPNLP